MNPWNVSPLPKVGRTGNTWDMSLDFRKKIGLKKVHFSPVVSACEPP